MKHEGTPPAQSRRPALAGLASGRTQFNPPSPGDGLVPNRLLITTEILLVIVAPLLILYLRGNWRLRSTVPCLLLIPVLWYLTYAPLHELSHVAGTYLAGGRVIDYKLMPRFWAGEFEIAWITPVGLTRPWQKLAMSGAPYVLDLACILAGMSVLRRRASANAFIVGLVFMLLCLRPAFDFVCESVSFLDGFRGDLYNMQAIVGGPAIWSFIVTSVGLSLVAILTIVRRHAGGPGNEPINSGGR
jgi:hypothetical protein